MYASPTGTEHRRDNTRITIVDRLFKDVQHLVDAGIYRPGTKLPSVREFAQKHGISPNTAAEVYDRLVSVNYVESRARVGFFVKGHLGKASFSPPRPLLRDDQAWRARPGDAGASAILNISSGRLPGDWRDSAPIRNALKLLSTRPDEDLLEYGDPQGNEALRKLLQSCLFDMQIPVRMSQLLLTIGASQATDLVVRTLLQPGDVAFIESPGYCALHQHLELHGVKVMCINREMDGPDLNQLERLARENRPTLFFVQSVLHSPTGSTISMAKTHRLLKLAEECQFMLVENDAYADMLNRYVPRLAALDPSRVLYLGSFSKTLSASARVGYIAGPDDIIFGLTKLKALTGISGSSLNEQLILQTLSSGDYRRALERLRSRLAQFMQRCCDMLETLGLVLFCRPLGGKYLWVRHPGHADARVLAGTAAAHRIELVPGSAFQHADTISPWFRINVAFSDDLRLKLFLQSL